LLEGVISVIHLVGPWSIEVLPCRLDENVCKGPSESVCERPGEGGRCYTYLYGTLALKLGIKVPFLAFECSVLRIFNVAPTQIHPNSWAFICAFEVLCDEIEKSSSLKTDFLEFPMLGTTPTFSLIELKKQVVNNVPSPVVLEVIPASTCVVTSRILKATSVSPIVEDVL
ncbi:hypothetical protein CR513_25695, partial [Mucuna pruriens]